MKLGKNKVLIKRSEAAQTFAGGFVVPDMMKETPDYGTIVEIGKGVEIWVKGDVVLFPKWSGFEVKLPGEDDPYLIVLEEDVWAALDKAGE